VKAEEVEGTRTHSASVGDPGNNVSEPKSRLKASSVLLWKPLSCDGLTSTSPNDPT
jgi:hypothetical protein